jgi:hypothetical protein
MAVNDKLKKKPQPQQQGQVQVQQQPKGSYLPQPQKQVGFQQPEIQPEIRQQPPDVPRIPMGGSWLDPWKEKAGEASEQIREWVQGQAQGMADLAGPSYGLAEGGTEDASGLLAKLPEPPRGEGEIDQYLDMVFGDEASFDPQQELLEEQRDKAMRQSMERMAAQGMLGTGAAGGAATDIMRGSARDIAQARQDWHQQQIGNAERAASMLFQDQWREMDRDHQKAMAELMFEMERKRKYGDDYDPEMGDYEMQLLMELATSDALDPEGKALLNEMLSQLFPDMFKGDPSGWGPPGPGEEQTKIGDDGMEYTWDPEEGRWLAPWEKLEEGIPIE